jgi:multidrug efflux system membrane fusion protein
MIIVVLGLVVYAVFLRPARQPATQGRGGRDNSNRPMPVSATPARKTDLNVRTVALGTVTPVNTVTVRSRVDGELQKIFFEEGKPVEAGAPLAEIDPRPFEVQKLQSEAQLAKDNALLDNARIDFERFKTLLEQDSVAKQQVDTQAALVRQYEASIKLDQAQVESSALQLKYAHITSPIAGRIGLRLVDQGNMVHSSDANGIAVIIQLHPITVLFSIPQDEVPKVMKRFATGEPMAVEAFDRDGHTLLAKGKLVTVDNQIDPTTGTVKLRAEFPNDDEMLFPNQFVNVQLLVEQLQGVTVVPTAAVQRGTVGTFVYLVSGENTVSVRQVETGPSDKGVVIISKGLAPGDVVVVDGVDKLREGSQVELVTRTNETSAAAPTASNQDKSGGKRQHDGKRPPQK